jgi:hypothetical protein
MVGQFYDFWQNSFPDCQLEPAVISDDSQNGTLEAVSKESTPGLLTHRPATIPATGKGVDIPFVATAKIVGSKFTSFHLYFDSSSLRLNWGWDEDNR